MTRHATHVNDDTECAGADSADFWVDRALEKAGTGL
jgi:hypothetical protein